MEPSQTTDEYYKIRGGRPLWLMPAIIVVAAAIGVGSLWYVQSRPSVQLSEGDAALEDFTVSDEEVAVMNESEEYILPIHHSWELFEEISHPERSDLSAPEIRALLGSCGHKCAATSVLRLGNFPANGCDTDVCREMAFSEGSALTIYSFPNPAKLPIDDFLSQALGLVDAGGDLFHSKAEDGSEVRFEVLELPNGLVIQTHYLAKNDRVYKLDMDINISSQEEYEETYYAVRRAIGLLVLQ